jgi:transposase
MNNTLVGVDLASTVFEVAISHKAGRVAKTKRLRRSRFFSFFATLPPATVVMEACGSAHFWARKLEGVGHQVVLLPPSLVSPYVSRNKTDRADAKAILEAHRNADIKPVPAKSVFQQTLASLHRIRAGAVQARTASINNIRGLLREFGILVPHGAKKFVELVRPLLADADNEIPDALRPFLAAKCDDIEALGAQVKEVEVRLGALTKEIVLVQQLLTIPGIGLLSATALVAFVGDARRFRSGRHLASYLGLTPREFSSGERRRLGRISKKGDTYLRTLLVNGARALLGGAKRGKAPDRLRSWSLTIEKTRGHNKAATALANKLARIAWAVWTKDCTYRSVPAAA